MPALAFVRMTEKDADAWRARAREGAVSKAGAEFRDARDSLPYAFREDREQKTGRGILRLILGQGVTPCAHRAGDLSLIDSYGSRRSISLGNGTVSRM